MPSSPGKGQHRLHEMQVAAACPGDGEEDIIMWTPAGDAVMVTGFTEAVQALQSGGVRCDAFGGFIEGGDPQNVKHARRVLRPQPLWGPKVATALALGAWETAYGRIVLLALLYLGVKHIRLGPSLPAFVSPGVLNVLVENFDIKPIGSVEDDIAAIVAGA